MLSGWLSIDPGWGLWVLLVGVAQAGKGARRKSPAMPHQEQAASWGTKPQDANLLCSGILPYLPLPSRHQREKKKSEEKKRKRGVMSKEAKTGRMERGKGGPDSGPPSVFWEHSTRQVSGLTPLINILEVRVGLP